MPIAEIIENEFLSLETFLANFDFSMQEIQSDIFDEVLAALAKFPQDNGSFVISDRAKGVILKLEERIIELINSGKYSKEYKKLIVNFDRLEEIRKEVSAFINPKDKLKVFKAETTPIRKAYVNQLSTTLGSKEAFGLNIVNPIKDILFEHSTLGLTVNQAARKLFDYSMGLDPLGGGGKLRQYAGQIARDSLFGFTGSVDRSIGDFIGAKDVNYLGNVIKDSRIQCVRWVDKFGGFIPADKLKEEIRWAKENGEGYNEALKDKLNEKTFAVIRGGFNCRHRVLYSNGKKSKETQAIEAEYRKQSDKFNKEIAEKLAGKEKERYEAQKAKVTELTKKAKK